MTHIEFKDVSISFQNRPIVTGVSWNIVRATVTAVMGPSGAGKSTLLRALNRLLEEEMGFTRSGSILLDGEEITKIKQVSKLRKKIGLVFQKPVIYPISIFKNVIFGVHHLGLAPKKRYFEIAERYLRETFLWNEVKDRLQESALKLSVGQQQRLAIARSLAVEPEVVLFDEPTSSLDEHATVKIEEMIRNLTQTKTVVLVTHDEEQAHRLARVIYKLA